jgi:hypothetical protein
MQIRDLRYYYYYYYYYYYWWGGTESLGMLKSLGYTVEQEIEFRYLGTEITNNDAQQLEVQNRCHEVIS